MSKRKLVNFQPWPETQKRLDQASKNGMNVSEMMNELVIKYYKPYLEDKAKKYSELAGTSN